MSHYFTDNRQLPQNRKEISFRFSGFIIPLITDNGVFCKSEVDFGSYVLLKTIKEEPLGDHILDLGCGYGVIGVTLGRRYPGLSVVMSDVNERAVELSRRNAQRNGVPARVMQSDGYADIPFQRMDWIVQNPPIRAGKSVIYAMFAEGARRLEPSGELWLVIRKQQGAESAVRYLENLFGRVEAATKKGGFWVLRCTQPAERPDEE